MQEKKYKIGYTQGTYDMFHIGHLNLIRNAKAMCERLIVGINSDKLVQQYKNKTPVICETNRIDIVRELRSVDDTVICDTLDKVAMWNKTHFDAIFIGDDWKGDARWKKTEDDLASYGVDVVYLKHTDGVSSTLLRTAKEDRVEE